MKSKLVVSMFVIAVGTYSVQAQDNPKPAGHIMVTPTDLVWKDGPPFLPPGQKVMVMEGDPMKPGPYTIRAKVPAGYKVPPHWHPNVEHVTVMEGTMAMGLGDKWDDAALHEMPAGSFMAMDVGTRHYFYAKTEGTIQVHGMGPFGITYVNPSDDPTKKSAPVPAKKKR